MEQRKKLTSSSIAEISYDNERKVLLILFRSGGLYSYEGVPEDVFKTLANTMSPGTFFVSNIRDVYPVTCLRPRLAAKQEKTHGADEAKDEKQKGKTKGKAKNAQV